ncbi:hypothetical protein D9M69_418020 [compost metagenome]
MDHGDVRAHAGQGGEPFAGERAFDELDLGVDLDQVGALVAAQHRERQVGSPGHVGVGQRRMAVLGDLQGVRPALLHRVAQAVQRADAGVAAPGEDQLLRAAGADQQVVDQVGGHAHQGQVFLALADQLVGSGGRDQVGETFEGNGVAIVDEALDGFAESQEFSHGGSRLVVRGVWNTPLDKP